MKLRLFAALLVGLVTISARADDSGGGKAVDAESQWITSIAAAGDGSFVAGTATGLLLRPGTVSRFQPDAPGDLEPLYEHPAAVWSVAATSDGKTIASADYKGNLVIYDVASKTPTTHEAVFERWCQKIVVSPDDQMIVAGNESGKLFAWSIADAKVSKSVELSPASITSLAFSPNKTQLAATDGDGKVHLLKWPELESVGSAAVGEETAWCVAYESDTSLIVGSADRNLYRVEAKPEAKPESIAKGTDWITRIAVSDAGQIAASEVSGKIHFASGGSVSTIGAESGVWALCFRGSGQLLVGTRKNGIVTAGQRWAWKPVAAKPAEAKE
ncbi:WD40 repeat domain-containing protein [Stieleria mannarensis]|uniref:WD40 repeat domain-containing protein n=1 Tax=Stieleria mannarensis TaxID=2755585 RepID=UPI00160103CD|nr:WD40 repeat domain-containing protein [Rhodopirellula sp. JC639]